jgi:hypothetical protein
MYRSPPPRPANDWARSKLRTTLSRDTTRSTYRFAINGSLLQKRRVVRETVMASNGAVEPATPLQ